MSLFATADTETRGILIGVVIAAVGAVIAWAVFHLIDPVHQSLAAIATFLIILLVVFLL